MSFQMQGVQFQGIRALGGSGPDDGYYEAEILAIEHNKDDKPEVRRVKVKLLPSNFETNVFMHLPVDGLEDSKRKGRIGAIRQILESLGYGAADIENPQATIHDGWFVATANGGRKGYVAWTARQEGVKDSYGEIQEWIPADRFAALKAAGTTPKARNRDAGGGAGGVPGGGGFSPPPALPGGYAPPPVPGAAGGTQPGPAAPPAPPAAPPPPAGGGFAPPPPPPSR